MSTPKTWAGQTFNLPLNREPKSSNWGVEVSNFLIHIANKAIPKTGGAQSLETELNFGSTAGLAALSLKGVTGTIAASGFIRLANGVADNGNAVVWRNAGNSADLALKANASNRLEFDAVAVSTISSTDSFTNKTLTDATNHISAAVLDSGTLPDARIQATGVTQHVGSIVHQSLSGKGINDHAAIDLAISASASHIANVTTNPHNVTKTNVGLGNVDDVKQLPNSYLDTDNTLAADSDVKVPSQKAVKAYADTKIPSNYLDTDGTLATNSDSKVATQKAVKTYAIPQSSPVDGKFLKYTTGGGFAWDTPAGAGDVVGPASSVDNTIVRFDGITGKAIQGYTSGAPTISDTGVIDPVGGFGTTTNGAASASTSGLVTTGAQTIAGVKTFSDGVKVNSSFSAYRTGSTQAIGASFTTLIFNTTRFDTLGEYNTSTGIFTSTKAGLYYISYGIGTLMGATTSALNAGIIIANSESDVRANNYITDMGASKYRTVTGTTVAQLVVGNTVRIKMSSATADSAMTYTVGTADTSWFTIYYIGAV